MGCTVIGEAGVNHGGSLTNAIKLAEAAKYAGADIVKFQTYDTTKLIRLNDPSYNVLRELELAPLHWEELARFCDDIGIEFLTTPGEVDSLKFAVEVLGIKRIKIGSDDLTHEPLITAAQKTNLPIILSTGMANLEEITDAIWGLTKVTLLHCVSLYPCPVEKANLNAMQVMRSIFQVPVGYSDHTAKEQVVQAAVAAGASVVEMHFMLDGEPKPIDAPVSFGTARLNLLIKDIRELELIMGQREKAPCTHELMQAPLLRKGVDGFRGQL